MHVPAAAAAAPGEEVTAEWPPENATMEMERADCLEAKKVDCLEVKMEDCLEDKYPGEDLIPNPGQATQISSFTELNNTLTTMKTSTISNLSKLCRNPMFEKKSIFYTPPDPVAATEWVQPDPKEVLFSNPSNHFHVSKKRLRLSMGSSKFVRNSSSRGTVRIDSLTADGVTRTQYQAKVMECVVVPAHSVSRIHCQLDSHLFNHNILIQDRCLDEEGDLRVPEQVERRQKGGRIGVWVANNGLLPLCIEAGTQLQYLPLKESVLRLPRKELRKEPELHSFQESKDQEEIDPGELQEVDEKDSSFQTVWNALELGENKMLLDNPSVQQQAKRLIFDYQDIFSTSAPGETDLVELSLKLKEGVEPIRQKVRPLNPALEKDLDGQIDQWLEQGVIEPSDSPWSSPLVPVKKKDGTVRWAVDFCRVNECLEQDSYPLPRIQQLLEKANESLPSPRS